MDFVEQAFTIPTAHGPLVVHGVVGVGSGLGYHADGEPVYGYTLVHLRSGRAVNGGYVAPDDETAKCWLALVGGLVDWTQELEVVRVQCTPEQVDVLLDQAIDCVNGEG